MEQWATYFAGIWACDVYK